VNGANALSIEDDRILVDAGFNKVYESFSNLEPRLQSSQFSSPNEAHMSDDIATINVL